MIIRKKLDFDDVLIHPSRSCVSSRADVSMFATNSMRQEIHAIPIVVSNMDATGTIEMAKAVCSKGAMVALHKYYDADEIVGALRDRPDLIGNVFVTIGYGQDEIDRISEVCERVGRPLNICIDVANGHTSAFVKHVERVRNTLWDCNIMAGSVADPASAKSLLDAGAEIIRVGIGSGSVCSTREKTGVGIPQISAIMECAEAIHPLGGLICSDGGVRLSGDIAKAFVAGADFVMCGYMFAGTDECSGEWVDVDGKKHLRYYGMASELAQDKHNGGVKGYATAEGRFMLVPYRGKAVDILDDILGGLRSCCTYCDAANIMDLQKAELVERCQ